MCGLAGIVNYERRPELSVVEAMTSAIRHRGPDGEGFWCSDEIALGFCRLKVHDLSNNAAQPMESSDGSIVLIFNGEIYNYESLRNELGNHLPWRSTGDTEVLLRAYQRWGRDCLHKLNGMFAFAIWDNNKKELFAARDRFGIKPFYFSNLAGQFVFASEIKAIHKAGIPVTPNWEKVAQFLQWGILDYSSDTWFENIVSLDPGHSITVRQGKISVERYYFLPEQIDESRPTDLHSVTEEYSQLLRDSLTLQLKSDRSVGIHLSGGLDSSVLASILTNLTTTNIDSYTFGFDERLYDERPYARTVANCCQMRHFSSILKSSEVVDWIPRVLREQDEPFTSLRVISQHKLYSDYQETGSTVVLEAQGGDEIAAGYLNYVWPWYLDNIKTLGVEESGKELEHLLNSLGVEGRDQLSFILGSAANYEQPGLCSPDGTPYIETSTINEDFLSKYKIEALTYNRPFTSNLRNFQYIDLMHTKLPRALRYADRASMATGRETRVPLLDHRIVEAAFSASNNAKISGSHLRRFMKNAAVGILPDDILTPNKRSVADPQKLWLKKDLFEFVSDIFHSKSFSERGIFNSVSIKNKYADYALDKEDKRNSLHVFQALIVELWFRTLVDSDTSKGF